MLNYLRFLPYSAAAIIGCCGAWWVQSVRIDSLKNDHAQYVQDQAELIRKAAAANQRIKETADYEYQIAQSELRDQINAGEVYRRCVAAGKCGAVVIRVPADSGKAGTVAPACRVDAASAYSVPVAAGVTENEGETPAVVNDCAVATLMLNRLQLLIESQPGY